MRKLLMLITVAVLAFAAGPPAMAQSPLRDFMYQQALVEGGERYVAAGARTVYHVPADELAPATQPAVLELSEKSAGKKKAGDKNEATGGRMSRASAPEYPLLL